METKMTNINLSDRARNTPPSPIRKLAHLAAKAKKSGIHVFHLNIGQPDIESPREFFDGLRPRLPPSTFSSRREPVKRWCFFS
jgi:hypothetical protein